LIDIREAIATILESYPDAIIVSTCGYISRDLLAAGDRAANFYLVGSMGMAAPIGLGLAIAHPERRIVVLDGDGSFAMNLGALPSLAQRAPDLIHVVLDNGAHESTGGQETVQVVDVPGLARASGYPYAVSVSHRDELAASLPQQAGLALIHIRCRARDYAIGARLALTPPELVTRFRSALAAREAA